MKGNSYIISPLILKEIWMLRTYYSIAFTGYSEILLGKKWIFHAKKSSVVNYNNDCPQAPNLEKFRERLLTAHYQVHRFYVLSQGLHFSYHKLIHSVPKESISEVQCVGLTCLRQGTSDFHNFFIYSKPSPFVSDPSRELVNPRSHEYLFSLWFSP